MSSPSSRTLRGRSAADYADFLFPQLRSRLGDWSYGTAQAVQSFGRERAADCGEGWYATSAQQHALATARDLEAMRRAWLEGRSRRTHPAVRLVSSARPEARSLNH